MSGGTIEALATWAARLTFADVPPRVVEKARWQQASVLAASLAGLFDPGARKVVAAARRNGGSGRTRVIAGGFMTSRQAAVFANASTSCTFDFDEILLLGHTGHTAVNVPLALGEELGKSWGEAVAAQVAANEIAGRLGLSTFLGPQNGQMLPYLHCASAAVAAGRLLGLDEVRLAHALAVAFAQPPAPLWPGFLGPIESKVIIAAHGAAMGLHAAELAAEGFTGALDLLDHPRGFFHRFTFAPFPRALTGLGRAWLSDTLQVKLHAACWYYQALLDGVCDAARTLAVERGRPLDPRDVRRLACRVTFLADAVDAVERTRPRQGLTANEVNFSIPAGLAVALLRGRLVPDDLTPEGLAALEPAVRTMAEKIEVVHDRGLTRRLVEVMDQTLDVSGLVGSASLMDLVRAGRRMRYEFPEVRALRPAEVLAYLARAPAALMRLADGRDRNYDLGARPVERLVLPISGAFELDLADGRRIEGSRDVEAGALSLPEAPERVAHKLSAAATAVLGADGAARLVRTLREARPETPVGEIIAATVPRPRSAVPRSRDRDLPEAPIDRLDRVEWNTTAAEGGAPRFRREARTRTKPSAR